ncbi:MAG: DUF502 domain-containing protein [Candidatus Marinimicrobia bacterium]|nr:DUF502 domain-containing protein [Candidatus Neomarinimicrobiota bacterium]MBT7377305.1 DUF502 domain-containing protein [Candidatus Neomarinimicrobiota bacterium]
MNNKSHFKQYIFTGLLSILPIYATYWIVKQLFLVFSSPGAKLYYLTFGDNTFKYLPEIIGFLLTIISIYIIGRFVTNVLGKSLLNEIEKLVERIPIVSLVYKTVKQITESISSQNNNAFKKVIQLEYPRKGLWTLAMVTGESKDKEGKEYYHLFVPTTPNPTSGYMIYALKSDTTKTELNVEEALKIIISGGMLASTENTLP